MIGKMQLTQLYIITGPTLSADLSPVNPNRIYEITIRNGNHRTNDQLYLIM